MFPALIKHQFPRASALQVTRLNRAPIHAKAQPSIKTHEEFYVTTAFPDDVAPVTLEDLLKMDKSMEKEGPVVSDKATTEKHMTAIWNSLIPKEPMVAMKRKTVIQETVREPDLDEL